MANYGNIFAFTEITDAQRPLIEALLVGGGSLFQRIGNAYFVRTTSKEKTKILVDNMTQLQVEFVFFYNRNSDGSYVRGKRIDPIALKKVANILLPNQK